MNESCPHYWIPNNGRRGEPVFHASDRGDGEPEMWARCKLCGARKSFTETRWHSIPATVEPDA